MSRRQKFEFYCVMIFFGFIFVLTLMLQNLKR